MGFINNRPNSTKQTMKLAAALGLIAATNPGILGQLSRQPKESAKPEFTAEELAWLQTLPKKEKKKAVAELKAKHGIKS
jgi:hypothetical protein